MLPPINRGAFFSAYRATFGKLKQSQVDGLNTLLAFFEADELLTDVRHVAYMLATVRHECADTWQPITEQGPRSYFDKYEPNTALGRRLGNKTMGDGYRTRGQGYVMLTGLDNYIRMNKELGLEGTEHDLVLHPEAAKIPHIAYRIMSHGMRKGRFTGKKLADYIDGQRSDYRGARRIINALDRAELIASYARDFEKILKGAAVSAQEVDRG